MLHNLGFKWYNFWSHTIGGAVGGSVGLALTVGGLVSKKVRCATLLMIPSLVSKRGRAVMFSTSLGFLINGPIANVRKNIQEVGYVETLTYHPSLSILVYFSEI